MLKFAYMNWSEFLEMLLNDFRMSENQLAQLTGLTQTTVNRISTGKTKIPYQNTVKQLEEGLQIKINDRDPENITYQKVSVVKENDIPYNAIPVKEYPVLATVYAGEAELLEHEQFDQAEPFLYNKPGHRCYALKISGRSMETTLRDGDVVLADMDVPLSPGCLVAVMLKDGSQYVKRYYDLNYAFVKLTSDNPEYGVRLVDKNDIASVHRIVSINLAI